MAIGIWQKMIATDGIPQDVPVTVLIEDTLERKGKYDLNKKAALRCYIYCG